MANEREAFEAALQANPRDELTHRAFADWLEENGFDDESLVHRGWSLADVEQAEAFMDNFAAECDIPRETLLLAAANYLDRGDYLTLRFSTPDCVWLSNEEFWKHFAMLTGRTAPEDKQNNTFIGCSC